MDKSRRVLTTLFSHWWRRRHRKMWCTWKEERKKKKEKGEKKEKRRGWRGAGNEVDGSNGRVRGILGMRLFRLGGGEGGTWGDLEEEEEEGEEEKEEEEEDEEKEGRKERKKEKEIIANRKNCLQNQIKLKPTIKSIASKWTITFFPLFVFKIFFYYSVLFLVRLNWSVFPVQVGQEHLIPQLGVNFRVSFKLSQRVWWRYGKCAVIRQKSVAKILFLLPRPIFESNRFRSNEPRVKLQHFYFISTSFWSKRVETGSMRNFPIFILYFRDPNWNAMEWANCVSAKIRNWFSNISNRFILRNHRWQ